MNRKLQKAIAKYKAEGYDIIVYATYIIVRLSGSNIMLSDDKDLEQMFKDLGT